MNTISNHKQLLLLLVFICSIPMLGISQSKDLKRLEPPAGKALVYIIRPTAYGGLLKMKIQVNGKDFGQTKGRSFLYGYFAPGKYTFLAKSENKKKLSIKLEAGKVYYLKQKVKPGIVIARTDLELLNAGDGQEALFKCKVSPKQGSPHFGGE